MRLGICCRPDEAAEALAAGYDYVELPANSTAPSEVTNLFFPGGVSAYAAFPDYNAEAVEIGRGIIDAAAARGVRIMVLGSGTARSSPEGAPQAEYSFYALTKILAEYARNKGITLAPESLNPGETNVATSLPAMATILHWKGLNYTVDSYHAQVQTDTPNGGIEFWRAQIPYLPVHVHFSSFDRRVPKGDEASLRGLFARLRELGYDARASLECGRDGIPDPGPLRRLFEP